MKSLRKPLNQLNRKELSFLVALSLSQFGLPVSSWASPTIEKQTSKSAACVAKFKKSKICLALRWTKIQKEFELPVESDQGEFTLKLSPAPPSTNEVAVRLWMPDMGHGSLPVRVAPLLDEKGQVLPGEYRVSEVLFSMKGPWEIQVELRPSRERAILPVRVPQDLKN
jgi:hypothetical protein